MIRARLTACPALALALALVVSATTFTGCGDGTPQVLRVGDMSPHFELQTLDGKSLDSRTLAGHPVILSFWATWCQPCYAEIPALKALDADPRVTVVTIALDQEGATSVRPFADQAEMTYTIALGHEEVFTRFSGFSIPFTLVLDAEGRVANLYRGPVTEEALVADIDELHGT